MGFSTANQDCMAVSMDVGITHPAVHKGDNALITKPGPSLWGIDRYRY
jgi:hypothetical protein